MAALLVSSALFVLVNLGSNTTPGIQRGVPITPDTVLILVKPVPTSGPTQITLGLRFTVEVNRRTEDSSVVQEFETAVLQRVILC